MEQEDSNPYFRKTLAFALLIPLLLAGMWMAFQFSTKNDGSPRELSSVLTASIDPPSALRFGFEVDSFLFSQKQIAANENLSEILQRYHVPTNLLQQLVRIPTEVFDVRKIRANKSYTLIQRKDSVQSARGFVYHPNPREYVVIDLGDTLAAYRGSHPVDTIRHTLEGTIQSSLYASILEAGGSAELVDELTDVFAWDIDFFGIQEGDEFKFIYTSYEVDGKDAGLGKILAASIFHMEDEFLAFCYDQGNGDEYFDEHGNSRRKAFLRAPLKFSRISSRFSYSRFHPVLKRRRPHLGVDYAAPRGTPVRAIGDGTVTKAAYSGGAGHMIKVRHNGNFVSGYLHLSRYGKGIRPGARVKQGQVIGYVGSTGLSTGPHLDFRIWKNGKAVNPLRMTVPSSGPICEAERSYFLWAKEQLLSELRTDGNVAMREP